MDPLDVLKELNKYIYQVIGVNLVLLSVITIWVLHYRKPAKLIKVITLPWLQVIMNSCF